MIRPPINIGPLRRDIGPYQELKTLHESIVTYPTLEGRTEIMGERPRLDAAQDRYAGGLDFDGSSPDPVIDKATGPVLPLQVKRAIAFMAFSIRLAAEGYGQNARIIFSFALASAIMAVGATPYCDELRRVQHLLPCHWVISWQRARPA